MNPTRIALIQTAWQGDRTTQIDHLRSLIASATEQGATLICLQEFALSPYFASDKDDANYTWAEPLHDGISDQTFGAIASEFNVAIIGSIFERDDSGAYWDTATLHDSSGKLAGFTRKVHIPQGAGYYEDYYYGGSDHFPVHQVNGLNVSIPTCYDQWFPELSRICALNGAQFIFYPTAIGSEPEFPDLDTSEAWQTVMRGQAIANGVYIAAANRIGREGVTFYGKSFICDPMGNIIAQASRDQTEILIADLDPDVLAKWRYLFPLLQQRRPAVYGELVK